MFNPAILDNILARLRIVERELANLADHDGRLAVLEERTCEHENRLQDVEEWLDKADDIIEAS